MRAAPVGITQGDLRSELSAGWSFAAKSIEYQPAGGGAYHWIATAVDGSRRFVTVDDLLGKPWLGTSPDPVFEGLGHCYGTAAGLAQAGFGFVVAPVVGVSGQVLRRLGHRYAVSLFPFVEGRNGQFGDPFSEVEREALVSVLALLHNAPPMLWKQVPTREPAIPGRQTLDEALSLVEQPWSGGPFSECARLWLAANRAALQEQLARFDNMADAVAEHELVLTHGEPHGSNVIWTRSGPKLIDWDTVALAPPERDLWLLGDWPRTSRRYRQLTGRDVDVGALQFFDRAWLLTDIALFVDLLRNPHTHNADAERACALLSELEFARPIPDGDRD
jgi:spectinomycin phosphotransferase